MHVVRTSSHLIAGVGVALALLAAFFLGSGRSNAEAPVNMSTHVVDSAGVLTSAQRAQLDERINRLYADRGVQLWVVYVRDFNGLNPEQWGNRTATSSGLGDHDVLLSVATEYQSYDLFPIDPNAVNLDQSDLDTIASDDVVPALKRGDWAGAGLGAANGIDTALEPSYTGWIIAGALGGAAVVGGGGALAYRRRRDRRRISDDLSHLRDNELTADQLAAQPLDVLDPWSREVLTDTDNAIRTSAEELQLAVGEFGEAQCSPFTSALDRARKGLADSFSLRQRLDDNVPETADERRSMLVQIITTCTDVDNALDAQVAEFDAMRNLLINADARFDQITQRIVALQARLDGSRQRLDGLIAKHGENTLASIRHNVDLAAEQITFAEASADQGRAAIAQPAGEQGPAVADIRSAEGAIEQAGQLLDAIDHADANIAAAHSRMPALIAEVEGELAEAAALTSDGGPALATAVAAAQPALQAARDNFDTDPLGVFTALVDADADLDDALAAARDASAERIRRTQVVSAAIESAQAKVSTAADFIGTRRGAVQSTARTRLAEAERLLATAQESASTDPLAAADAAR
ncbi:TPM domain-containing protein, partial [Gordonia sp. NPDC003585]|uniref:TPM domain-containing protein n=1 Tax=Gordonia sp. NPDC003585 TaxID=3154275 RepID=UPI0033A75C11